MGMEQTQDPTAQIKILREAADHAIEKMKERSRN